MFMPLLESYGLRSVHWDAACFPHLFHTFFSHCPDVCSGGSPATGWNWASLPCHLTKQVWTAPALPSNDRLAIKLAAKMSSGPLICRAVGPWKQAEPFPGHLAYTLPQPSQLVSAHQVLHLAESHRIADIWYNGWGEKVVVSHFGS